jgi:hypothetical protein
MKKYRKKPVKIEAEQWFIDKSINGLFIEIIVDDYGPFFYVETLEGSMKVRESDWIIRGIEGEIYPCKDPIFKKTYEEVNE